MNRRMTAALACILLVTCLAGCALPGARPHTLPATADPSGPAPEPMTADTSSQPQTLSPAHLNPDATTQPITGLNDMSAEQKHSQIAPGFVSELPVVAGNVTSAKQVGANRLDFEVSVSAPSAPVEQWYRTVMPGRAFVLKSETPGDGGTTLGFTRAGSYYIVRVAPDRDGASRVISSVGNGPVPTQ